jgi:GNAT superfamily N-acetyltransferase
MARMTAPILQLRIDLETRPEIAAIKGLAIRTYRGDQDPESWLEIRHRAFAREKVGVRQWTTADFATEFLTKPWWSPQRLWFAETTLDAQNPSKPVGTVALALRGSGPDAKPVVHWLAVLPGWRRRGVGRLLLTQVHQACWDAGYRQVWLETHAGWEAAVRLYRACGYRNVRP